MLTVAHDRWENMSRTRDSPCHPIWSPSTPKAQPRFVRRALDGGLYSIACFVLCPHLLFPNETTTPPVIRVANSFADRTLFTAGSGGYRCQVAIRELLSRSARINIIDDRSRGTAKRREKRNKFIALPFALYHNNVTVVVRKCLIATQLILRLSFPDFLLFVMMRGEGFYKKKYLLNYRKQLFL